MARSDTTAPRAPARPAYILSLTVENIRCFGPPQTLDLSDGHGRPAQWTVILGENNVGKSTLLQNLAMLDTILISDVTVDPDHAKYLYDFKDRSINRMGRLAMQGGEHVLRRGGTSKSKIGYVVSGSGINGVRSRKVEGRVEFEIGMEGLYRASFSGATPLMRQPTFYGYGAARRMDERATAPGGADDRCASLFSEDVSLRDPEDWMLKADYNARLHGADAERFAKFAKRVQDALVNILPEVDEIRIQAADEPGGSPRVEARTPDGWLPLRRLGFGYQSQIAWLVDFASRMFERYPDSPDPLAEPAVVLVDEIDLHMHPRWQRQVIGDLTERCPNTQFIVTAHSPLVVQAAAGANIVLLRREDDHVVIDNDPEVLSNWRVDQILTSGLFGVESARPPQIERQLKERRALLAKPKLSKRDKDRLAELETQIGELPAGESAEDRRAMDLIRRAAEKLQSET